MNNRDVTDDIKIIRMSCNNPLKPYKINIFNSMIKRAFDIVVSFCLLIIFLVPAVFITLAIKLTSKGPALYWSSRVGQHNRVFMMPKFRSMKLGTPMVATRRLADPTSVLTPIGGFLRKTSLDEIPQFWSIIKGDMSFVGPRPVLCTEEDLIALRAKKGIDKIKPGLTGWAQINGRDTVSVPAKVALDEIYMKRQTMLFDLTILWLTVIKVIRGDNISH